VVSLLRKIEIWQLKPKPCKVASVCEDLFEEYLEKKKKLYPNDLGTNWFGRMMAALFKNDSYNAASRFAVVDVTNTARSIVAKINLSYAIFNTTYYYDCGTYIGIGTGTASPTKSDIKLASEVARLPASATFADGGDVFVVSATFSLASNTYINEIGLYWKEGYYAYTWLLDRTVLSQSVLFPANTPMSVAYIFAI
jgi:hypothetical protein